MSHCHSKTERYRRLPDTTDWATLEAYAVKILNGEQDGEVKCDTFDDVELHVAFGENVFLTQHNGIINITEQLEVWLPIPPFQYGDLVRVRESKYNPWLTRHFKGIHPEYMSFYTIEDGDELEYDECIAIC